MLHILDNQATGAIAEPAVVRSAFLSVVIHGSVFLFLLSLAFSPAAQSLPDRLNLTRLVVSLPPPPPTPAPPASAAAVKVPAVRTPRAFSANITAPAVIPNHAPAPNTIIDAPPEIAVLAGVPGGIPGGLPGGVIGGILSEIPGIQFAALALAPAAAPPEVKFVPRHEPQRIQVDAEIQEAMLLDMVQPVYPVAAKITRMTGTVRLRAIINTEGRVAQLQVIDGPPLLAVAARAAVEKWRYRPTILNGAPVEVATNIIVHFRLT